MGENRHKMSTDMRFFFFKPTRDFKRWILWNVSILSCKSGKIEDINTECWFYILLACDCNANEIVISFDSNFFDDHSFKKYYSP